MSSALVDDAIARVARGQGALDLAVGETLARLFAGERLVDLGYSAERDYARERLGMPPRTMYEALALGRVCAGRPLLRKAVAAALVSPSKARVIAPVVGSDEPAWTALAMTSTVRELVAAVRAAGKEPPEGFEAESMRLSMSGAQQDRLERALALAAETLGGGAPRWQCYEALAQEWLSEFGEWAPEEEERGPRGTAVDAKPLPRDVEEHLAVLAEAAELVRGKGPGTSDPKRLDALLLRLMRARRRGDLVFGGLALRVVAERVWAAVGYRTLKEYCTERLGMTPSVFRQRVWLERRMFALPALREAFASGALTYTKALLVASEADESNVLELIDRARATTWQQTERETTAREDRRNRAKGIRRLWAPVDVMRTIAAAIVSAQRWSASEGRPIGAGEALAVVSDHFVDVWSRHRRRRRRARREVFGRSKGICAVPGCSRPARHLHHIRYRSRGGGDEPWNQVALCAPHHLRGIHEGLLSVTGRAGERLFWRFGDGGIWVTHGDDDVRRADVVGEGRAPAYAA